MALDILYAAGAVWVETACQLTGVVIIAAVALWVSLCLVVEVTPHCRRPKRIDRPAEERNNGDNRADVRPDGVPRSRWVAIAALVLTTASTAQAATLDGRRQGLVLSIGGGAAPLNSFTGKTTESVAVYGPSDSYFFDGRPPTYVTRIRERTWDTPSIQMDFAVGLGISNRDVITLEHTSWTTVDSISLPPGSCGFFWTHYLKPSGAGLLVRAGAGKFISSGPGWLTGRRLAAGAGYEFPNHLHALISVSGGSVPGLLGDYSYFGVSMTVRHVWY